MATQAQQDHQVEKRLTRYAMMDDDRPRLVRASISFPPDLYAALE
jgi:hypothetical protein